MQEAKKTFNVQKFKLWANEQLARTDVDATQSFKQGICASLEHILMSANDYQGYNYIYWNQQGYKKWHEAGEPEDYETKNQYMYGPDKSEWIKVESKYRKSQLHNFLTKILLIMIQILKRVGAFPK